MEEEAAAAAAKNPKKKKKKACSVANKRVVGGESSLGHEYNYSFILRELDEEEEGKAAVVVAGKGREP